MPNWFKSYITRRQFYVSIGHHVSIKYDVPYGVAQGSCLGPLLFSLYTLPLGNIIKESNIHFYNYTDDTQLNISVEPNRATAVYTLNTCLSALSNLMGNNFLKLNEEDKTEILLIILLIKKDVRLKPSH